MREKEKTKENRGL